MTKKQLILVTSTFNSTSLDFNSFFNEEEDDDFIPVSKISERDFFPTIRPKVISAEHSFTLSHSHANPEISALDDRVFCIGGYRKYCTSCSESEKADYFWDRKHCTWTTLLPRKNCSLHVLRGKMYRKSRDKTFMEVLDNDSTDSWTELPLPPRHVDLNLNEFRSSAIESKGFFLIGSKSCDRFYSYEPPSTWKLMENLPFNSNLMLDISLSSPVVTEDLLLWLHHGNNDNTFIIGFDHNKGVYFTIDLKSKEGIFPCPVSEFPVLACVGNGVLTLVWIDSFHFLTTTLCHCVKFRINVEVEGSGIRRPRVTILSRLSRVGPPTMQKLCHAFYM